MFPARLFRALFHPSTPHQQDFPLHSRSHRNHLSGFVPRSLCLPKKVFVIADFQFHHLPREFLLKPFCFVCCLWSCCEPRLNRTKQSPQCSLLFIYPTFVLLFNVPCVALLYFQSLFSYFTRRPPRLCVRCVKSLH